MTTFQLPDGKPEPVATTPARAARGRTVVAVDPNENALRDLPDDIRRAVADTTDP